MPSITLTAGPMTELDAVNQMLLSIGQAPVNTLEVSNIKDVSFARLTLNDTLREVLSRGWSFNTDRKFVITPDVAGFINVPSDTLDIDCEEPTRNLVQRGATMYDLDEQSANFSAEPEPLEFRIVRFVAFDETPAGFRQYVAMRAGRVFQSRVIGSQILYQFTREMEAEAYATLLQAESRTKDTNLFRAKVHANRIFHRRY